MGLWDIEKIPYVGREKGPQEGLAFHYYDADKVVAGKKMKDWLRFGVAWWHTFDQELVDPFGTGTAQRPWYGKYSNAEDEALAKVDYAFEFFQKLGVEYSASMIVISLRKAIPCARPTRTWTRSSTRSKRT